MAQRVISILVDDLDGTELDEADAQTVSFGLDGQTYEIDLSTKNADALRAALDEYVQVARKTGKSTRATKKRSQAAATAREVRDWARSNGYEVPARGRIPAPIHEAFKAAH